MTETDDAPRRDDRFMPDWVIGLAARLALAPGLWLWGRAWSGAWPGANEAAVAAAGYWSPPFLSAELVASLIVWGAQLAALLLVIGFMSRVTGFVLLLSAAVYAGYVMPEAWTSAAPVAALAFYLFARGGGAMSLDGAIVASTR